MTPSRRTGSSIKQRELAVKTDLLLGIDQVLVRREPTGSVRPAAPAGARAKPDQPPSSVPSPPAKRSVLDAPPIELPREGSPEQRLQQLHALHDRQCPQCSGSSDHQTIVFGEGDPNAQLMFVGEAPGAEEDRTGRPFVGRAGRKLDEMIKAMGFERGEVYIANVLKTRPPDNRTPLQHEVEACGPYLAAQVQIIQPEVIIALGGPAAKLLLQTETGITRLRGRWGVYDDGADQRPVMPTFHPAYLLRNPTVEVRGQVWDDLKNVLERLGRPLP